MLLCASAASTKDTSLVVLLSIIRILFVSELPQVTANEPEPCLLRCKDNYMNGMQSIMADSASEWSINLVTPLQNLFHHASRKTIKTRVETACRTHDVFMACLEDCGSSAARQALITGQAAWSSLCRAYRTQPMFEKRILPCWAEYGDEMSRRCHIHALMVQNSVVDLMQNGIFDLQNNLADLCRTITIYDKCYITQSDQYCGEDSWRFLLALNQKASAALIRLLSDSGVIEAVPPACKLWTSPDKYAQWHAERITAFRGDAGPAPGSSALFLVALVVLGVLFGP